MGGRSQSIDVNLFLKGNDPKPKREDLQLIYPTRGERLRLEKEDGDAIYNIFRDELEKKDNGKIVAIDIDAKKIISKGYDRNMIISDVQASESSGRIRIRRVSSDGHIGVENILTS